MQTIRIYTLMAFLSVSLWGGTGFAQSSNSPTASLRLDKAWIEEGKQVFLARTQLETYREELDQNGVGKKLGVDQLLGSTDSSNGFVTLFEQSVRLVAFNTLNYARLLFTNEETTLLDEWSRQYETIDQVIGALYTIYSVMEAREVRLDDAFKILEAEQRYAGVRSWVEALSQSPWWRNVVSGSEMPKRPVLPSDFGLEFKTNFVDDNWAVFLSEQLNIANVYIFWRGPQMIAALGQTKLGIGVSQALHLDKLIASVEALPTVVQKPALWMIYETADGCVIRYFYTAYLGLHQLGQQKITRVTGTVE